jgi:hypothetical protein
MVANGTLYIRDQSHQLTAYSLPQAPFTSIALTSGWNSLGIPSDSYTDAAELISDMQGQNTGLAVRVVATYQRGRFALYVPGYSQTLPLQPTQGVYVLASGSGSWKPQGTPLGPAAISVRAGWNFLSLSYPTSQHASSICTQLINSGITCQEVAIYQNGTYMTYLPNGSGTDFTVTRDQGFMVLTQSGGSWTPS